MKKILPGIKKALSVVTILFLILFLFVMLSPEAQAETKEIILEWEKTTIEPDLAGFTIYEYIHTGATVDGPFMFKLTREIDISYTKGDEFIYNGAVALAGGEEYRICYDIDAYDKSGNHSDKSDQACIAVDYKAPDGCVGFRAIIRVVEKVVSEE